MIKIDSDPAMDYIFVRGTHSNILLSRWPLCTLRHRIRKTVNKVRQYDAIIEEAILKCSK
jgi:hypothetical protein